MRGDEETTMATLSARPDPVAPGLAPSPALAPEVEDVVTLRLDEFFASANALPVADLDQIFGTGGIVVVATSFQTTRRSDAAA